MLGPVQAVARAECPSAYCVFIHPHTFVSTLYLCFLLYLKHPCPDTFDLGPSAVINGVSSFSGIYIAVQASLYIVPVAVY